MPYRQSLNPLYGIAKNIGLHDLGIDSYARMKITYCTTVWHDFYLKTSPMISQTLTHRCKDTKKIRNIWWLGDLVSRVFHTRSTLKLRERSAPSPFGFDTLYAGLFAMTLALSSCAALDIIQATPQPMTETPAPSPTIDWFPASATPTLQVFPTQPATPEMRPGLGRISLTDDFSNPKSWLLAISDQASTTIENHHLTIAVQPGVYMFSQRQGLIFDDFYAEITARPNLCRGGDEYGMLVRGNALAAYRFVLACDGTVRADRASLEERHPIQAAVASGDAPPGAPGEVRIGVWAVGAEMRLFLNGRYQFSITDSNYLNGPIGVFARSTGDTPVTVTFYDLSVREVTYSPP
jgi:hypothetical protein